MHVLDPYMNSGLSDELSPLWTMIWPTARVAVADPARKLHHIIGIASHDDDTATAKFGTSPPHESWVFIEDQPEFYGDLGYPILGSLGYPMGDWLRTHSITLLGDSLALMRLYQRADPELSKLGIETIFAAASNQRAYGTTFDRSRTEVEGASLEDALYALERALSPDRTDLHRLRVDLSGAGFGHLLNRTDFHRRIAGVGEILLQRASSGAEDLIIKPLVSMRWVEMSKIYDRTSITAQTVEPYPINVAEDLVDKALQGDDEGLAYRFALSELSPIVVIGADYSAVRAQLRLNDSSGDGGLTEAYVKARAEFLAARLERGVNDNAYATAADGRLRLFEDRESGESVGVLLAGGTSIFGRGPSSERLRSVRDFLNSALAQGLAQTDRFGSDLGDILVGAGLDDRLFGGGGNDLMEGKGGVDYLEGGAGSDRLLGGGEADRLLGGAGDDELVGGAEDDVLIGGAGADTYVINSGDGTDIIRDTGRNFVRWNGRLIAGIFEPAGATGFYRFLSTEPSLSNVTLTFNSPATLSDGSGAALVFEDYQSPQAFDDGDFGITLLDETSDPVTQFVYMGNDEADLLNGSTLNDRVLGQGGGDYIFTDAGDDYVDGGEGDDRIFTDGFLTYDPYLYDDYRYAEGGPAGADVAIGGAGSDTIIAGRGDDRLYADRAMSLREALERQDAAPDPGKGDWLAAGEGDDVLIGSAASDVLTGGGGEDILVGGAGNDFLMGDANYVAGDGDWVFSVRGDGSPGTYSTYNEALNDPPSSAADTIYGGGGADWAWAGRGDDVIDGGAGDDLLFGNLGSDTIEGGEGDDILAAGSRKGVDLADPGEDYLSGGAGNDTLYGSAGDTILFGGDGDDRIFAGPGADVIDGGAGNDRISGQGADVAYGGEGEDEITVYGTLTASLYGGEGADRLRGDRGEDSLFGEAGDDVLTGGEASDLLDGGGGNDRYVVAPGSGVDELYDESGEDVIEIQSIEGFAPQLGVTRESIRLVDSDDGGVALVYGIVGDGVELGPEPLGVIERMEIKHYDYTGVILAVEVIDFAELWAAYLGPIVQPNAAPDVGAPLLDAVATEDEAFSYQVSAGAFVDPDADDLLFYNASLTGGAELPAWLGFDPLTGSFQGVPTNADVGGFEVMVTATDLFGASASAGFLISVTNTNDAPQATGSIGAQSVEEESRLELALPVDLFADEDAGESLGWLAGLAGGPLPGWLSFDPEAKTLSGTPTRAEVGTWSVVVSVQDAADATASLAFDLTVTKAPGQTLSGGAGSEVLQGGPGDDTLLGSDGADALLGGKGDDTFVLAADGVWSAGYGAYNAGSPGNPGSGRIVAIQGRTRLFDTLDGGEGEDTVQGSAGHDALFLDDGLSPFPGMAVARLAGVERFRMGAGNDVVDLTSFDFALGAVRIDGEDGDDLLWASAGDDALLGGSGRDELYGGAGADHLSGGTGDDSLDGAYGADVLQGGEGSDTLLDTSGSALLDGGAGNDALTGGAAAELFAGGAGTDSLRPGGGTDVVLYNRGDGADRIAAGPGARTLSLGGGIAYEDLALERTANHLLVHLGSGETIELTDWYASAANQGFATMQVIAEAMAGFEPGGGDPLRDEKIESFDFQGLVAAFDAARAADSMITRWQAMHALLDAHLGGSDEEAIGGELAYRYAMTGTMAGQDLSAATAVLASPDLGSKPQAIASGVNAPGGPALA
jgi:Ca2+-binding RTX toxin-like protein